MKNLVLWYVNKGYTEVVSGIEELKEELGIKVKEYPEHDLYVFNYCQIESPKTHPVVMECRGLILRNDFTPVCRPFDRFFNLGEALEITKDFDVTNSIVYEKLDGSLVKMYFHDDQWHVATRGTAFAESENYTGDVFYKLIANAFGCNDTDELDMRLKEIGLPTHLTFIFEYTSPNNRIVTPYSEDKMYLLGIRDNLTGCEFKSTVNSHVYAMRSEGLNVDKPKTYQFSSSEEMREFANNLGGLQEGFVAHDIANNIRVKIKADQYVTVHKLRGDTLPTPKRIMGLVVTNETEEYLVYFPEERERFKPYIAAWDQLHQEMDDVYNEHKSIESQKEFALAVKEYPYAFVLFQSRSKQEDPFHTLSMIDQNKKVKLLSTYMGVNE